MNSQNVKQFNSVPEMHLTLKGPRKKIHLKMSSAEVVCCKPLPYITDK